MAETKTKEKSGKKLLVVIGAVLLAVAVLAAIVVLGVYRGMHIYLRAELGDGAPEAGAFMRNGAAASYAIQPEVSLKKEGTYLLTVKNDDGRRKVLLIVRDTKAPTAEGVETKITIDDKSLKPAEALTEIKDASKYTVKWQTEPKYGVADSYNCSVVLEDAHGNTATVKTVVHVLGAVDVLTYEMGTPHPTLADFMVVKRDKAELLTDLNDIDWTKPGNNTVEVKFDGKTYSSILRIVDTTAPKLDVVPVAVLQDAEVHATDFLLSYEDESTASCDFTTAPSTEKTGTVACEIKATDLAGNATTVATKLYVCDAVAEFEACTDMLSESALLQKLDAKYAGYKMRTEPFLLNSLGAHPVVLENGDESVIVGVTVKDTVAPTADGISCPCSTGYPCAAIKFAENIVDVSEVRARFAVEPDWNTEGEQDAEIILVDRAGNETTVKAKAVVSPDKTAPVIYGPRELTFCVGEDIGATKEVFAVDNADPDVTLKADTSKVENKAGDYEVTFTAKDEKGNESTATVKVRLVESTVTADELDAAAQKVIDEIFTEGMTAEQQVRAVFDYVYNNITVEGSSDKADRNAAAFSGLTEHKGDRFTCYAVAYTLLQRADCRVLSVQNGSDGFWCLVDLGNGWYHFDACKAAPQDTRCFMKTSAELGSVSSSYWSFDGAVYPSLATRVYSLENR